MKISALEYSETEFLASIDRCEKARKLWEFWRKELDKGLTLWFNRKNEEGMK